ncbi:OmpP1/FadL family transporter [Archangium lipolyticum]|uniref:OmpP1/FadL family transporter n=1 Tax=Archangium lipolyticum TaxID=2970465 RepID=UPI00214A3E21|nr:OmpP1/FadL family transporter [Archangium lipolyticum]
MKKTLLVVTLLAAGTSQAAGLAIDTQNARATGMGSVGVASSQDASAIYYNPAGILGVTKLDAQLGDSLILLGLGFTREGGSKQTQNTVSPPPHAYFVYKFDEKVAAGVGVFTPFGANSNWPDDFVGRFLAKSSKVATYDINPTVAFAPMPWLRFGAGFQAVYGTVDVSRQLNLITTEGTATLSGNDWGIGFNAGVQADVVPQFLTLGVQYRSQVDMRFKGDADFNTPPEFAPVTPPDQPFTLDVTMPASLGLGVAIVPLPKLLVSADVNWVQWSTVEQLYFQLQDTPQANPPVPKNWEDRWNVHVGAEYGLTSSLAVRAGFVYDPTPSPEETLSPDLPDADRMRITVGAGYSFSSFRVDAGYQLVLLSDQESTFQPLPGTYSGSAHVVGLTLGYSQ